MRDINSLNKVLLIGRLGQKPELRYIQEGNPVCHFTLATNERGTNPTSKQTTDRTEWHRIVVWGKLAEFCDKYLTQGKQVLIEGKLRTRQWQDKQGNKRSTTEIVAWSIVMLGKREAAAEEEPYRTGAAATDFPADEAGPDLPAEGGEDDIPF
jgi:single-strand DNA-binding protein